MNSRLYPINDSFFDEVIKPLIELCVLTKDRSAGCGGTF